MPAESVNWVKVPESLLATKVELHPIATPQFLKILWAEERRVVAHGVAMVGVRYLNYDASNIKRTIVFLADLLLSQDQYIFNTWLVKVLLPQSFIFGDFKNNFAGKGNWKEDTAPFFSDGSSYGNNLVKIPYISKTFTLHSWTPCHHFQGQIRPIQKFGNSSDFGGLVNAELM